MHHAEQIQRIGKSRLLLDQRFEVALGGAPLPALDLGASDPQARPWHRVVPLHGFEEGASCSRLADTNVQLRSDARGVEPILLTRSEARHAQIGGLFQLAGFEGIEHVFQREFAMAGLNQALRQRGTGVRFEQIAVQCRFRGFGHQRIGRFAGHHHEHGRVGQRMGAPQFVQQVASGHRRVVEMVVAQDDVEDAVLDHASRLLDAAGLQHVPDAHLAQHGAQQAARTRVGVDDEGAALAHVGVDRLAFHRCLIARKEGPVLNWEVAAPAGGPGWMCRCPVISAFRAPT